jgi:hypothetical protein
LLNPWQASVEVRQSAYLRPQLSQALLLLLVCLPFLLLQNYRLALLQLVLLCCCHAAVPHQPPALSLVFACLPAQPDSLQQLELLLLAACQSAVPHTPLVYVKQTPY